MLASLPYILILCVPFVYCVAISLFYLLSVPSLSCFFCHFHPTPFFSVVTLLRILSLLWMLSQLSHSLFFSSFSFFQLVFLCSSQLTASPSHALPSYICPCHHFGKKKRPCPNLSIPKCQQETSVLKRFHTLIHNIQSAVDSILN